jgi:membrane-bound lytic murein transglycosylase B
MHFAIRLLIAVLACTLSVASFADVATWADDDEVQSFIAEMQQRHGFDAASLHAEFARQGPDETVLRLIKPPTHPTQRSWQRYRARFLTPRRITHGLDFWREHGATVARAAGEYGVPPQIIVAIIGVETEYGRNTGSFNVFNALATLAFRYPPRRDFFRDELEQFLLLARDNRLDLATTTGSFAGAIGIPQFMPGSERRHAIDYDGDGRVDLAASTDDAIGSVARFLANHGWQADRPIAVPARNGERAPGEWLAAGIKPRRRGPRRARRPRDAGRCDRVLVGLRQFLRHHALQPQQLLRDGGDATGGGNRRRARRRFRRSAGG